MIYLVVFTISALFLFFSDRTKDKKQRFFFTSLSILIPSILAGLRDLSIGTDTKDYGILSYESALESNSYIIYMLNRFLMGDNDPGFYSLVYIISLFFDDFHWGLFFYELITVVFFYLGFHNINRKYNIPVWFVMLLVFLETYNISLNAMRQMIATSIILYASSFLFEEKYKKFILWIIVAFTFHGAAISSIILLPIYYMVKIKKDKKIFNQIIAGTCIVCGFLFLITTFNEIVTYLVSMGVIRPNYLKYINGGLFTVTTGSVSIMVVLIESIYMISLIIHFNIMKKRGMQSIFYLMVCMLVFFIRVIAPTLSQFLIRISIYFLPLQVVAIASISQCYQKKSRILIYCIFISLCLSTWIFQFVIKNAHETIPYMFM